MTVDRQRAVETLFLDHGKAVGNYVMARLGDAELAEAITARVFLTVVRRFDQCKSSPVGWLWSIVRSELARHFRDHPRHERLDEEVPARGRTPPEELERGELAQQLQSALAKLTEPEQQLIGMKFFAHMRNTEIAQTLGTSPSQVGVAVHRALKRLRALMATGRVETLQR